MSREARGARGCGVMSPGRGNGAGQSPSRGLHGHSDEGGDGDTSASDRGSQRRCGAVGGRRRGLRLVLGGGLGRVAFGGGACMSLVLARLGVLRLLLGSIQVTPVRARGRVGLVLSVLPACLPASRAGPVVSPVFVIKRAPGCPP